MAQMKQRSSAIAASSRAGDGFDILFLTPELPAPGSRPQQLVALPR
jgi:hypothetical protein